MKRVALIVSLLGFLSWCAWSNPVAEDIRPKETENSNLRESPTDEVISQLPEVTHEGKWDEGKQQYVYYPACAELRRRLRQGQALTDAQWQRALINCRAIRVRPRWPGGELFAVSMRVPAWLPVCEIRLKPRAKGLKEAKAGMLFESHCGTYSMWTYQAALCQRLGQLPLGKQRVVFDVVVEQGRDVEQRREDRVYHTFGEGTKKETTEKEKSPPPRVLWKGELAFDVNVVPSVDEAVPPVQSDLLDKAVRNSLGVAFSDWYIDKKMQQTAILVIDPDVADYPALADTALSLKVEILNRGAVVEQRHLVASSYDPIALAISVSKGDRRMIGFCVLKDSPPADLKTDKEARKNWSLRVSGTSDDVIYLWEAKQRWSGSIEIPVDELIEREKQRTKGKERVWVYSPTIR